MKYILAVLLNLLFFLPDLTAQSALPDYFLEGKSVVFISSAPQASPAMEWNEIADFIHMGLVELGGDPVAYYELEDVTLSEEVQQGYANAFERRLIRSVILITRKANGAVALNISAFSGNKSILTPSGIWSLESVSLEELKNTITAIGQQIKSKNFLVLEVPEFPNAEDEMASNRIFFNRNPLNLDVFKIGIPLSGSSGDAGLLMAYRYDLLGKNEQAILAEQQSEKSNLELILENNYPYQFEFLTTSRPDADLVRDRIQFILMRMEGKEGDLMQSMGLPVNNPEEKNRIVVKYYIRLIVRDELYIGPEWDADPDWRKSLENFLKNIQKN